MNKNRYKPDSINSFLLNVNQPADNGYTVTLSDTVDLPTYPREIYVGTGGNIKMTLVSGDVITLFNVPDGMRLPYVAKLIWSTGTTASNIIALY